MCYTSRSSFIMDIFFEGKIEEIGNRKGGSQPKLNKKIYQNQTTIGRQIQKLGINN